MTTSVNALQTALTLDPPAEIARIATTMRQALRAPLRRRGFVVAISGGVDSAVCAALAVEAVGRERVFGLLLPERESSTRGLEDGTRVSRLLGIRSRVQDITSVLEALGCYERRDDAIREVLPEYGRNWKSKLVIGRTPEQVTSRLGLVVESPSGEQSRLSLPVGPYLKIVAASNYKQRVRKSIEYCQADSMNYAVVGTPNRLEFEQGFFVKQGDGAADIKPIAHLYKSQVMRLAEHFGLPESVRSAAPTTDTYPLEQTQEEFFFDLPLEEMDAILWAQNNGVEIATLSSILGRSEDELEDLRRDSERKRRSAEYLHAPAVLVKTHGP